jgi:serine/threonine-protein kinase
MTDPLVGQMLDGRFMIEMDLTKTGADEGGIGLVYLARDLKFMGKETVVKILQKSAVKDEYIVRKFIHEKEALIRLDHPNIVRILDFGNLSDGRPFIVMEYLVGHSLRRKLQTTPGGPRSKLSFSETAHIVESVTKALGYTHSKNVLHRDLKPENIMLTGQDDGFDLVRLIDFGIARVEVAKLAPVTEVPRGIGTVRYMAPEQFEGKLDQTPALDIYAFAIIVYEMLTGDLPFHPESHVGMYLLEKSGVQVRPGNCGAIYRSRPKRSCFRHLNSIKRKDRRTRVSLDANWRRPCVRVPPAFLMGNKFHRSCL